MNHPLAPHYLIPNKRKIEASIQVPVIGLVENNSLSNMKEKYKIQGFLEELCTLRETK